MSRTAAGQPSRQILRLNPFIFPSETVIRFILLNIALLGATLYAYLQIGILIFRRAWEPVEIACVKDLGLLAVDPGATALDFREQMQQAGIQVQAWQSCMRPVFFAQGLWMLAGAIIVLGAALVLYWSFSGRITRRQRLTDLTKEDAPELVAELQSLSGQAGLASAPRFLWNPLDLSVSGQAFGRPGHYAVALTGGLASRFFTDAPAFRAIVLHELAHLHNRDVDISYFTLAVWQAFLILCLLPFGLALIAGGTRDLLFSLLLLLYTIPLSALGFLARNSVLRTREYYADLRVSAWEGVSSAIDRVLASMPAVRRSLWQRVASFHPNPADRRQSLHDPAVLLGMGFWEALGIGLAASVAVPNVVELFDNLIGTRVDLTSTLPALLFAPLAMGIVGLGAYRISFANLTRGKRAGRLFPLSAGLALGIMSGFTFSLANVISQYTDISGNRSPISAGYFLTGLILTCLVIHLLLCWIAACAEAWLEKTRSPAILRLVSGVSILTAVGIFMLWMTMIAYPVRLGSDAWVFFPLVFSTLPLMGPLGVFSFFDTGLQYALGALLLLLLQGLWIVPLAAWMFRKPADAGANLQWTILPSIDPDVRPVLPRARPLRPLTAFLIGAAGGAALTVLFLFIGFGVRLIFSEEIRGSDNFRLVYLIGQVVLAGLGQAGLGAITALAVPRQGVAHGLLTVFVAGVISSVGFLIVNFVFGGSLDASFAWLVFTTIMGWGFVFGLAAAILAASLRRWVRG